MARHPTFRWIYVNFVADDKDTVKLIHKKLLKLINPETASGPKLRHAYEDYRGPWVGMEMKYYDVTHKRAEKLRNYLSDLVDNKTISEVTIRYTQEENIG